MKKKVITVMLMVSLCFSMMPLIAGASNYLPDLSEKSIYYTPDYRSGECILSATKVMLRRAAIARKSYKWDSITNTALRGKATTAGGALRNSFSYTNDGIRYNVMNQNLTGNADNKLKDIKALLANHPEGIVVWGRNAAKTGTHGVLVTGFSNGKLYAVDSTHNNYSMNKGIEEWGATTMRSISYCSDVWFFKSISGGAATNTAAGGISTLCATGITQPDRLTKGKGFGVTGSIQSNYKITNVTVSIVNSNGIDVISRSANPGSCIYALGELDSAIKFGTLPAGTYTYKISASDEITGNTVLHANSFEVVGKNSILNPLKKIIPSTMTISSVKAPTTLVKGKSFTLKGKIKSPSKIKNVKVQILTAEGKKVRSASSKPKKKSYNIKKLSGKMKFKKLKSGSYIIKVKARNSSGWQTLLVQSFTVQ